MNVTKKIILTYKTKENLGLHNISLIFLCLYKISVGETEFEKLQKSSFEV